MRIIAYSSGAWPCGIADYHGKLTREFPSSIQCDTTPLPTDTVHRDRPVKLWERRRHYARLAARSGAYDVSLIQFITHWNGHRDWEYALPVFARNLRVPFAVILHEWPPTPGSEASGTSAARRLVARASAHWDRHGFDHEEWLRKLFLGRAGHIFVHSEALRDRALAAGIPPERVTFAVFPVATLPANERAAAEAIKDRYRGRRFIVIFGFPHPRKSLELAIQALPQLPPDVMLLFVGGIDGEFRQQYVQSLMQLAERLGVQDRAVFVGEVPEASLRAVLESAQFALAPFAYATGSSSFAYLMSAGVPILASDLPEHHMLRREGAGIALFETGNLPALTAAVNELLDDREQRERLSMKSRAFVNRHSFGSFANTVVARLQELAAAR
jgi:glycosyltransferase involved in cell wall biosynthesis